MVSRRNSSDSQPTAKRLVLAITGASGAPYAVRLLQILLESPYELHLTISPAGAEVVEQELGRRVDVTAFDLSILLPERPVRGEGRVHYHHYQDFRAGIASGSFRTQGMVICPCSMGTVAAIAHGTSQNLIHRAADVHLKEGRRLILVPRETPMHIVQLQNLVRCAEAGATVLPAMPAFYTRPRTLADAIDFIVGRICDQLDVPHQLFPRWGEYGQAKNVKPPRQGHAGV
jgi:4-hydroxy-3-polyprenylbenzoate decarboxylase